MRNKGGHPKQGEIKPGIVNLDLVNGWLPQGVAEDDTNREVCRQLRVMWARLTQRQQRLVIMFEANPDFRAIGKQCGYSGNMYFQKAEEDLKMPVVQKVLRLRTTLVGGTLPTVMSRRILAQMILGTHEIPMSATSMLQAMKLNAMLAGEMVPEVEEKDLPAGGTNDATREESDRIMVGALERQNIAELFKRRSKEAQKEREAASQIEPDNRPKAEVTQLSVAERMIANRQK